MFLKFGDCKMNWWSIVKRLLLYRISQLGMVICTVPLAVVIEQKHSQKVKLIIAGDWLNVWIRDSINDLFPGLDLDNWVDEWWCHLCRIYRKKLDSITGSDFYMLNLRFLCNIQMEVLGSHWILLVSPSGEKLGN